MPYYLIKITTNQNKVLQGIKENSSDIDFVHELYYNLAATRLGQENILQYECYMISKNTKEVQEHLRKNVKQGGGKPRRYGNY